MAGMACKSALAILEVWTENVDTALKNEVARSSAVQELKLESVFRGEASIDLICLLAQAMLSLVPSSEEKSRCC